jgi:hypothetical protein
VQPKLWEEADEKANTQATEPVTPYLRGGGDRHSESIAATTHEADEIKGGQSSEEEKQLEAIDAEFPPPGIADDDDAEMAQLEDWFDEQVMAVPVDTDPTEEEPE